MNFDELARVRLHLQNLCEPHAEEIPKFSKGVGGDPHNYFDIHGEPDCSNRHGSIKNLTTTATCIQSLARSGKPWSGEQSKKFSKSALNLARDKWVSGESAGVYCRVRALPVIVDILDSSQVSKEKKIGQHLTYVFQQLIANPEHESVGEHGAKSGVPPSEYTGYPANAYHTYWASQLLDKLETKGYDIEEWAKESGTSIAMLRALMNGFARRVIGREVALHSLDSSQLDTDQLTWATAHMIRGESKDRLGPRDRDLLDAALTSIFTTQTSNGSWPRFDPLFHYKASGNAHSYMFEALAELLEALLQSADKHCLILLRKHAQNLVRCIEFLDQTRISNGPGGRTGWTSGHRTNQSPHDPESWATANVYDFLQACRQLFGHWTKEQALRELPAHKTKRLSKQEALKNLKERGATWVLPPCSVTVGGRLQSMFVHNGNPESDEALQDPDKPVLDENQACSVILFGPPGASKTTMSRALAYSIGWDYVEIHASDFVADGLPNVQKTADAIFNRLLQLSRVVILFDEIDELVRSRTKDSDAFGRFLTTSMLPKLASLWESKQVIYIVATNHLEFFDSAIVRSGRFDARLFAGPPTWKSKDRMIRASLAKLRAINGAGLDAGDFEITGVTEADITSDWEALEKKLAKPLAEWKEVNMGDGRDIKFNETARSIIPNHLLGCLLPLRFDEMSEVAYHLNSIDPTATTYRVDHLKAAVEKIPIHRFCDAGLFAAFEKRQHEGFDYGKAGAIPGP